MKPFNIGKLLAALAAHRRRGDPFYDAAPDGGLQFPKALWTDLRAPAAVESDRPA
jgi:DNA-binding response OmpR family regulator